MSQLVGTPLPKAFLTRIREDIANGVFASVDEALDARSQDGDDDLRRKLSKEEYARLVRPKDIGFIYFLLYHGTVVYVGVSRGNFANRITSHRKKGWKFSGTRVLPVSISGHELLLEEQRFIHMFSPKYNKSKWLLGLDFVNKSAGETK